jgi:two-component system sensor histidine kinase ChvG
MHSGKRPRSGWIAALFGRVGVRLLVVNLVVLLVPVVGLEFARLYEHQLLASLERDMRNQAAVVREHVEAAVADGEDFTVVAAREEIVLERAARSTRTRIRLLDRDGKPIADSHRAGPPEGEEAAPPSVIPDIGSGARRAWADDGPKWPDIPDRPEVRQARVGTPSTTTRIRGREPAVLLFLTEPIRHAGGVSGVVYVTRSTQPVLVELYRIRTGLLQLLGVALAITAGVTLALAWSITRPLVRLSGAARRVAGGELSVSIPVTGSGEIRELGEAFASMKERLIERLRFASEFTADVAHELKSPLTSIRGAAELLGEGAFEDPEARTRFLKNIELDVARLDRLVTRLLLLGRIEASQKPMEPVDLGELARCVAERCSQPDRPVKVEARHDLVVTGRADDLETALANLVENAVRHSPAGAAVHVTVERRGAGAVVRVVDRGPGISEPNREKIFERFFTTEGERGGTGLGLAIARSVALAHGGDVVCESAPGEGATFTFSVGASPGARRT